MNKIKKMALEHYKDVLEQEIRTRITMSNITSYELGAKAVLEEIEKILNDGELFVYERYDTIERKVKELKGYSYDSRRIFEK